MERRITYNIPNEYVGRRLSAFLKEKGFSHPVLSVLKNAPDCVRLNGAPCRFHDILQPGDILDIDWLESEVSPNIVPEKMPLSILYEDDDVICLNKPAGIPLHPSSHQDTGTLANGLAEYYASRGDAFVFRCMTRLDRDTSGVVLIAKHSISAGMIAMQRSRGNMHRRYFAICNGNVQPAQGQISAPLGRKPGPLLERYVDWEHGESAITDYRVLELLREHTLVALQLQTGRTHQIRIHMKHAGFPLIGDYLYNPDYRYMHRQALHAAQLCFLQPVSGNPIQVDAPLPDDFTDALEKLRP